MQRIKKIAKLILNTFVISILTLILLEITYRYQLIDFYSTEWESLNKNQTCETNEKILIFGDSFSADPIGWVTKIRVIDTNSTYYNASIPGTGLETFRLIAKDRIDEVNPSTVIIQLYIGNDLYDFEKPVNWNELSILRNLYWSVSSNFRVLNYLNYKSGQFAMNSSDTDSKLKESFSVSSYSERTKLYIRADSTFPVSTINLEGKSSEVFSQLVESIDEISQLLKEDVTLNILIIPHCTQVHKKYRNRFRSLGCDLNGLKPHESIWSEQLRKKGYFVIDPLEEFQKQEEQGEEIYFQNDPHLNSKGQDMLSNYILNQLK